MRRRCLLLHDDTLDTAAHGVLDVSVAPLPFLRRCVLRVATTICFTFLYFLSMVLASLVYFRVLTICHKGDTMFLHPEHNLRSSLYPKRQRR